MAESNTLPAASGCMLKIHCIWNVNMFRQYNIVRLLLYIARSFYIEFKTFHFSWMKMKNLLQISPDFIRAIDFWNLKLEEWCQIVRANVSNGICFSFFFGLWRKQKDCESKMVEPVERKSLKKEKTHTKIFNPHIHIPNVTNILISKQLFQSFLSCCFPFEDCKLP